MKNQIQNTMKRFIDYQDFEFRIKSCLSRNPKNRVQTTISENFKELAI